MTESSTTETTGNKIADDTQSAANAQKSALSPWRILPLVLLVGGLIGAFAMDFHYYLSFESLQENRSAIMQWKQDNYTISTFAYVLAYGVATAISLPGAIWLTIAGGFMFGAIKGGLLVLFGATLGAVIIFLAARYAFADFFHAKCGTTILKMETGFQENAFSYLLVLRFVPLFPFWLVNIVPAFLGVSVRTFVITTFFGIMPGTFVYSSLGNGLGHIIDKGGVPDISMIWSPEILVPLLGLALLALIPVAYRKLKKSQ
tara:strand:- start:9585 stop:10361 length:777 start_codon:yes stop_codon:yes gene_type:complete